MDCDVYAPITSPQLLAAAGPHGLRKVAKAGAVAAAPYAADYSFCLFRRRGGRDGAEDQLLVGFSFRFWQQPWEASARG